MIGLPLQGIGAAHGVPLDHDPLLAEALLRVELDQEIPRELYRAVAIVIGFVLGACGRGGAAPLGP